MHPIMGNLKKKSKFDIVVKRVDFYIRVINPIAVVHLLVAMVYLAPFSVIILNYGD